MALHGILYEQRSPSNFVEILLRIAISKIFRYLAIQSIFYYVTKIYRPTKYM